MKTSRWILKTIRVLCFLVLLGALSGCNLGPKGPCYTWMATGNGHYISIQYGTRRSSTGEICMHRSNSYAGSGWWKDSISDEDAGAAGGDELYVSAGGDQTTTITTKIVHLENSNNETTLAENTATSSCESDYVFAGEGSYHGGGTVICTELHCQGLMDEAIWKADEAFGKHLRERNSDVLIGYHFWAKPVVSLMQKSRVFTQIVNVLAKPWSYEMACIMGENDKGSVVGKILMDVGVPMCRTIGRAVIWAREHRSP